MHIDNDFKEILSPLGEWFAVIDGGRYSNLPSLLKAHRLFHRSLFLDTADAETCAAGPWLVRLDESASLERLAAASGKLSDCVFWRCDAGEMAVFKHLRTIAVVEQPSGERVMFRHYDPRVLIILARHLEPHQERRFFGPCAEVVVFSQRFAASGRGLSRDSR